MDAQLAVVTLLGMASGGLATASLVGWWQARQAYLVRANRRRRLVLALILLAMVSSLSAMAVESLTYQVWPLSSTSDVLLVCVVSALVVALLAIRGTEAPNGLAVLAAMCSTFLVWRLAIGRGMPLDSSIHAMPKVFSLASHLTLGCAAGIFVQVGCGAIAQLLLSAFHHPTPLVSSHQTQASDPVAATPDLAILGLVLLLLSLLFSTLVELLRSGVPPIWALPETWKVLLALWYGTRWCAITVLGWKGKGRFMIEAAGLIPTLALLSALVS